MKKISLFVAILFCCSTVYAENDETKVTPNEVSCEKGFVMRKGSFKVGKRKFKFSGVYSADGSVCVKCWPYAIPGDWLIVAPGTKTIARNALISTETNYCYLPNSVTKISTDASV